jgi:integrase
MEENNQRIPIGEHVTMFRRGKRKTWTADFWHQGQHGRKSLRTRHERKARARAAELDSRIQQGLDPTTKKVKAAISICQAKDDFLAFKKVERKRKKTISKYRGILKKFEEFAKDQEITNLRELDLQLIDRYRASYVETLAARSMHNEAIALKHFLGWCTERDLITANPLGSRKFRRPRHEPRGGPTLAQVNAVLEIAPVHLLPVIAIAAFAGHRSGDIERLLVEDVDFAGNWIHFESRPGAETKTGNSTKVPLHPRLCAILKETPKSKGRTFFTAPPSVQFPNGDHHLNMRDVNEQFQKLLKQLDIPAGKKAGGFTFHSLRSFFKTHCVNAGIPREVVDAWQDHVGDRRPVASDGYYKLSDEDSQAFMKKVHFGDGKPAA